MANLTSQCIPAMAFTSILWSRNVFIRTYDAPSVSRHLPKAEGQRFKKGWNLRECQ